MKKISLIALGLVASLSVSAQPDVVKNAEGLVKKKQFAQALEAVKPALSNPETMNSAEAWFLAGEASMGLWDEMTLANIGNALSGDALKAGSHALLDAYGYYVKALPLDKLPDAKGKVKEKYTKKIKKAIGENYHNYLNAGVFMFDNKDYPGAYEAWDLYVNLPKNEAADPKAFVVDADSLVGRIAHYQAVAAYQTKESQKAIDAVDNALGLGFSERDTYLIGVEMANRLENTDLANKYAREGNKKYGANDIDFLSQLINSELEKSNYPACYDAIDESYAIAANDSIKSLLYNTKAIIYEREGKMNEAKASLEESIKLFPTNAKSYFDMGRLLQNEVAAQEENADEATRQNVLAPTLIKAVEFYEKSYNLDDSRDQLANYIYRIYYQLDQNYHLGEEYAKLTEKWNALR